MGGDNGYKQHACRCFRSPALPLPPTDYNQADFAQFNNVLRLYFNQIDNQFRRDPPREIQAQAWFLG